MTDEIEWPREIWMAERDDHDQGVVSAVLSEHATIARFEGDTESERAYHRYVDGDIFDSSEKYWRARLDQKIDSLTVKRLVWYGPTTDDATGMVRHETTGGVISYTVYDWSSVPGFGRYYYECLGCHETLEAAKAAAQADYERRIRGALKAD